MTITTTARAIRERPDTIVRTIVERLAQGLANMERKPAYVVDDNGHLLLSSADDINVYWRAEQIVFTAYPADPHS